jgi:hypothetical protein
MQTVFLLLTAAVVLGASGTASAQEIEWVQVFPCESDCPDKICDAGGNPYNSTGPGYCTWFKWNGAGDWKRFKVREGVPVIIKATGDSGPGACLGKLDFKFIEIDGIERSENFNFDGPTWSGVAPDGEPKYRLIYYVPGTEKFEIFCTGGFYVRVYQQKEKQKDPELTDEEKAKVADLIEKLGSSSWRERENAHKELKAMGERILPLLEKEKDSPDFEVRVRVKKIIESLTPATGEAVSDTALKREATALVGALIGLIAGGQLDRASEPTHNLVHIGPYAAEPLEKQCTHASKHVRTAVALALTQLKSENAVQILINMLKNDREPEVRATAAFVLANFGTEEVIKALKEASENDTSERVCKQAMQSLNSITERKNSEKDQKTGH